LARAEVAHWRECATFQMRKAFENGGAALDLHVQITALTAANEVMRVALRNIIAKPWIDPKAMEAARAALAQYSDEDVNND
jgi:hypothetical protein